MTNDTVNRILVAAALIAIFDSLFPRLRYVWKFLVWSYKKLKAINFDQPPTTLHIPRPAKGIISDEELMDVMEEVVGPPQIVTNVRLPHTPVDPVVKYPGTQLGAMSPDGVTKVLKRNIMCPTQGQLLAFETTRFGFPGTRYLVERHIRGESQPRYKLTPSADEANAQWFEWYDEMKKNGFGGCSGTGLDGTRPF